ncbi:hypothetical protein [Actinocorallia populi]|uniref:hypothetical protein n=1 Tax=Actinocorallia populi TaxID=2079200 RepID=UPI000D09682A|nr:hypothetical protein [Actinocorallia populi]
MRPLSRTIVFAAVLALGLGTASPVLAAPTETVRMVATSLSGKRIYLEHHFSYCLKKNRCDPSAKDGTHRVARYAQKMKVRRGHGVWINTVAVRPHRLRVYVDGRLVRDERSKWYAQGGGGFHITDHTYFHR